MQKRLNYKEYAEKGLQFAQEGSNRHSGKNAKLVDMYRNVTEITMLHMEQGSEYDQMNIKQGVQKHGNEAIAAVIKEYEQLRDMDTVTPINFVMSC